MSNELEFSKKYDQKHAERYFHKHDSGFWRSLSTWRERLLARNALKLAGNPKTVLDVPCGTGRFWGVLAEQPDRVIHACDNSQYMINAGLKFRDPKVVERIQSFQGSAFDLSVDDEFVETVFCIRLIHHIGDTEDRLKLLTELRRVASSTVIISLWVDGNLQAWKRKKKEAEKYKGEGYQNRFLIPAKTIESEFEKVGLQVEHRLDFIPYHSMWRTYVLRKI